MFALSNVPDLYFVHQRSKRIALFWIMLQTGVYLGVPIGTQINNKSGWHMHQEKVGRTITDYHAVNSQIVVLVG
jgi:hypothetical protein